MRSGPACGDFTLNPRGQTSAIMPKPPRYRVKYPQCENRLIALLKPDTTRSPGPFVPAHRLGVLTPHDLVQPNQLLGTLLPRTRSHIRLTLFHCARARND